MTDRELRKLSRAELLELLLAERKENERLHALLNEANEKLASRLLLMENAGTMAEAALRLNGVFEAADRAVRQYLENACRAVEEKQSEEEL